MPPKKAQNKKKKKGAKAAEDEAALEVESADIDDLFGDLSRAKEQMKKVRRQ